ncbi:protein GRIP [Andrographis paniculata]|uniref:protein GRIP n=1 Tax=Andrographis paniculata TaxID=175694 RepID=UPI0021E7B3F3|nr:protein GRIP [Andrographis paniculata]
MSEEVEESSVAVENHDVDSKKRDGDPGNSSNLMDQSQVKENGYHGDMDSNYGQDELVQMVVELNFQNEYMKSQYEGLKDHLLHSDQSGGREVQVHHVLGGQDDQKKLGGELESLRRELDEERQTRGAVEEALKHLRAAHSEADMKAQELSAKLAEVQEKMNQEIKERDEKYSELDSKLNRLHKRAKQRIQEVQKEKDDLEAQLSEVKEKSDLASSQLSALQQELDRTRQHANEALKAMDGERQQLRSANNKLRDTIEELRHSLVPKENALEAMQQSIQEKDQMLEEMRGLLQAADEKRQLSIEELSLKHQKQVEDMQAQIAEVLAERSRAAETISSLRTLVAEKDTKIAEMDAASSGEAARLRAAMETLKGELTHIRDENEKEKEGLEATLQSLRSKLEISESSRIRAEVEAAKLRSQLELELSVQTQKLSAKDSEINEAKEKIKSIESEFASYKVRAHALLQKKDSDLAAARDNDQLKALEEALKEAEKEILLVSAEKDKVLQDVKDALTNSEKEISSRDEALSTAEKQIKSLQLKLDSALSMHQSEKETWDKSLQDVEQTWRLRCETLERQSEESSSQNSLKEIEDLKSTCKRLKEEQNSFQDLADKMLEEKDKEISRILDENKNLRQLLDSKSSVESQDERTAFQKQEACNASTSMAEQQILILARQQAQREEELAQTQRHILALQEEIEELEHENRLHRQQEAMLKEELRNMERVQKREGVDLTYLKNVILKLLETGEVERLLPVIAMLLQFSPDEMQKCQQAYRSSMEVAASPSTDSGRSLFSRLTFS